MNVVVKALGVLYLSVCLSTVSSAVGLPSGGAAVAERSFYFWQTTSVARTAELISLFCRGCDTSLAEETDVPLVSILRDTLGDNDPENDRIMALWVLTYVPPTVFKRALSAVPFFYWRAGEDSGAETARSTRPLLDLTALQHPMLNTAGRDILQWAMLDPSTTPIRATSRAYRTNEMDHERLHLEEAISYLRAVSPGTEGRGLTVSELHTLIARLELRKTLLGGFVTPRAAAKLGREEGSRYERIRSRNWELLRQCADKTGLRFEELNLAGTSGQYAMLWYPLEESPQSTSNQLASIWKLLGIKDPWKDPRLSSPTVVSYVRDLDENGNLLPPGVSGARHIKLTPLGVYSLSYPTLPLLLVDFRDKLHVRWHEMAQRSINEITAGLIGVSHFTNWYYYVAADVYDFIASRHGAAMSQSERLDSYSEFRVKLALDRQLDPVLRQEMQRRVESMAINPLESAPRQEMKAAAERYDRLRLQAEDGRLENRLNKERRAELAQYSERPGEVMRDSLLHFATFGAYTHRAKAGAENLAKLDRYRRLEYQLNILDQVSRHGTQPEVAYDAARMQHSILEIKALVPEIESRPLRSQALATLKRVEDLSRDGALQAECSAAIAWLEHGPLPQNDGVVLRVVAPKTPSPKVAHSARVGRVE